LQRFVVVYQNAAAHGKGKWAIWAKGICRGIDELERIRQALYEQPYRINSYATEEISEESHSER
jgi:hypothetical protein